MPLPFAFPQPCAQRPPFLSQVIPKEKNKSSEDSTIKKILFLQKYQRFFRPLTDVDSRFTIVFASTEQAQYMVYKIKRYHEI